MILSVHKHGYGCHFGMLNMGILMYADDLVLISSSVTVLQSMIDLCINELNMIDLSVNIKKSVAIRIGKNWCDECSMLSVGDQSIPWSKQLIYLGVTISSGNKFVIELKPCRSKFYRSFNSIYSKIFRSNEFLIVSLVKTFCVSIVMYSLDALVLNSTCLNSLDNLFCNAFGNFFKTYDRDILYTCMYYLNCWPLRFEYFYRRVNFLTRLGESNNSLLKNWYNVSGNFEYNMLCKLLGINIKKNKNIKNCIWQFFASTLGDRIL